MNRREFAGAVLAAVGLGGVVGRGLLKASVTNLDGSVRFDDNLRGLFVYDEPYTASSAWDIRDNTVDSNGYGIRIAKTTALTTTHRGF